MELHQLVRLLVNGITPIGGSMELHQLVAWVNGITHANNWRDSIVIASRHIMVISLSNETEV